jgi:hypothetical protein
MAKSLRYLATLSPYQSLGLLAVPVCLIEPLKLVAVAVAGEGHWITGTAVIIAAYLGSVLVVERLFRIAKPQLLMLPWFGSSGIGSSACVTKQLVGFRRIR